jgi:DNA-directed RNA polymerase III subunit RPC6
MYYSLLKMGVETRMIYGHVEGAGRQGTWKRSLTLKTNLHENTVGKSLKELISRKLVKEIKSAKHPTRRIYMLGYMQPSDENSGGNFFNEGVLDGGLILNVGLVIVAFLDSKAWAEQPGHPKKDREYKSQISKKKRGDDKAALANGTAPVDRPLFKTPENWKTGNVLVPHPADYRNYPTVADIQAHVAEVEVVKDITLGEDDIHRLLGKLELDGQVERMRGEDGKLTDTYRSVRNSWSSRTGPDTWYGPQDPDSNGWGPGNGLTQSPCGRCPVFKECRPGGIVSPQTCVYLDDWLQF